MQSPAGRGSRRSATAAQATSLHKPYPRLQCQETIPREMQPASRCLKTIEFIGYPPSYSVPAPADSILRGVAKIEGRHSQGDPRPLADHPAVHHADRALDGNSQGRPGEFVQSVRVARAPDRDRQSTGGSHVRPTWPPAAAQERIITKMSVAVALPGTQRLIDGGPVLSLAGVPLVLAQWFDRRGALSLPRRSADPPAFCSAREVGAMRQIL